MKDREEYRLTHTLGRAAYQALRRKAADDMTNIKDTMEAALLAYGQHTGPYIVPAVCPSCQSTISVSTSGRVFLGGPGNTTPALSAEALEVAESWAALKSRNPAAAEAVEALVRSL